MFLHLHANKETRNMVDRELLSNMKKGSILINTSRGGIVDEKELYKLLKKKSIGSAYFDVLNVEPPKNNSKLLKLKNFFISPHIGGSTKESIIKGGLLCIKKLAQIK